MDYGQIQSIQPGQPITPDFFTAGAGTNDERLNNFEPENNLDLTNSQTSWSTPAEAYPQHQHFGQQAINSVEYSQIARQSENTTPALGEVVPLDMPPTTNNAPLVMVSNQNSLDPVQAAPMEASAYPANQPSTPEYRSIKTGDTLSEEGIKVVDDAMAKFNQDGNVVDFYDSVRDMMETNLENSYNRKLAA